MKPIVIWNVIGDRKFKEIHSNTVQNRQKTIEIGTRIYHNWIYIDFSIKMKKILADRKSMEIKKKYLTLDVRRISISVAITLSVLGTICNVCLSYLLHVVCIELAAGCCSCVLHWNTTFKHSSLVCETVKVAYHLWIFTKELFCSKKVKTVTKDSRTPVDLLMLAICENQ